MRKAQPLVGTPILFDRRPGCAGQCAGREWKQPVCGVRMQLPYALGKETPFTAYFCADCAKTPQHAKQAAYRLRTRLIDQFAREAPPVRRPVARVPKVQQQPVLRRVRVLGGSLTLEIEGA